MRSWLSVLDVVLPPMGKVISLLMRLRKLWSNRKPHPIALKALTKAHSLVEKARRMPVGLGRDALLLEAHDAIKQARRVRELTL